VFVEAPITKEGTFNARITGQLELIVPLRYFRIADYLLGSADHEAQRQGRG